MTKVSIIIPVYNTEKYLRKCLESVINQTLKDIEIICVDDGSTDACLDILNEYARLDKRVKVLHKENGGLVSARKAGIAMALGKYAGYVDSDDWIEPDMYESLYRIMEEKNVELVTCGYCLEGSYTTIHLDTVEEGLYEKERMGYLRNNTIYHLECRETGIRGSLCCKLFSTGLLKRIQQMIPDEISIAEDKLCLLRYILDCASVYVLRIPLYHWVIHRSSMSHVSSEWNNTYLLKLHYVYQYLTSLYLHPDFTEDMRYQAEIYMMELMFLGMNKRMGFKNRNMVWIDPYWMELVPEGAEIVLYGAGELGEKYKNQLQSRPDIKFVAMMDDRYEKYKREGSEVISPDDLETLHFDYIIITIKNREKAANMKEKLICRNIPKGNIIWCEQPEAYWRYIEAERTVQNEADKADR